MKSIVGEIRRDLGIDVEVNLGHNFQGRLGDYLWSYVWSTLDNNLWELGDVIRDHLEGVL